jgi:hypothetical protein
VPDYVKRIGGANVSAGGSSGSLLVWPTAHPTVAVQPNEKLSISLRLRRPDGTPVEIRPAADAPSFCRLRREGQGTGYWLDVEVPSSQSGTYSIPLDITGEPVEKVRLALDVRMIADNLVATPKEIDLGTVSSKMTEGSPPRQARIGIRSLVGTFRIKALSSSLPFVKLEARTVIEGTNYLIRVTVDPKLLPARPGPYSGAAMIDTDDGRRVQVPLKISVESN